MKPKVPVYLRRSGMTADEFATWRAHMGFTQAQAAAELGITARMVRLYETGEKPVPKDPSKVKDITIPRAIALACAALAAGLA